MEERDKLTQIGVEPLTKDNYEHWFNWVKNYLIAQDLWQVVDNDNDKSIRPDDGMDQKEEYLTWQRKNAAAMHIICISCGPHALSMLKDVGCIGSSEAKFAWGVLSIVYVPADLTSSPEIINDEQLVHLCEAICDNNLAKTKNLIGGHNDTPGLLAQKISSNGETALHVAARYGHINIVKELLMLMPPKHLEIRDSFGRTPLETTITHCGKIMVAKCLVEKNSNILVIEDTPVLAAQEGNLPVTLAFELGLNEMGRYLYFATLPLTVITESSSRTVLLMSYLLKSNVLDLALHLLQGRAEVVFEKHYRTENPIIDQCANYLTDFLSKSQLVFWKRWIYHCMGKPSTISIKHHHVDIPQEGQSQKVQEQRLIHKLISFINKWSGMEEIHLLKLQRTKAKEILDIVCKKVKSADDTKRAMVLQSLFTAAMKGNAEFLLRVSKASPELAWLVTLRTSQYGGIFFKAVECRQAEVFNLINDVWYRNLVASQTDIYGDSLLDKVARLAPSSHLNHIQGAALQMQSEMRWFKEVERVVEPVRRTMLHKSDHMDAFRENHKELRKEGEQWMREMASSCSVVGALIVTIMFTAAFTVPGGNDQTSGYPVFLKEKFFIVFVISVALSLFSSTISVLTFLGILSSRYAEEDFLDSLPNKLIIGLSTLFLSIATMMLAFSTTIVMMLQQRLHTWNVFSIIMFASFPVTVFVLFQSPLLIQIISSTYSPVISRKKKYEPWP